MLPSFRIAAVLAATLSVVAVPEVSNATPTPHARVIDHVVVSSFSEKRDLIDQGVSHVYSGAWAHVSATTTGVSLSRSGPGSVSFTFDPVAGQKLTVGQHGNLQRAPFAAAGFAGINITGPGAPAGCARVTGSYYIWDIAASATGVLTRLDLTYVEHCDALPPSNFGEVLINDAPHVGTLSASATRITFPDQTPLLPYVLTNSSITPEPVRLRQSGTVVTHFWLIPVKSTCASVVPAHGSCAYTLRLLPPKPGVYAATMLISAGGSTMRLVLNGSAP
ncbi:MAG: hypothetical protein PXZ08_03220 [Actinomycetota bacterium]|nr:hypothetical protein [Actinomycetota bacterium]